MIHVVIFRLHYSGMFKLDYKPPLNIHVQTLSTFLVSHLEIRIKSRTVCKSREILLYFYFGISVHTHTNMKSLVMAYPQYCP